LPPALSTDEALVVAPRTDAMVLVVTEGVTRREGLSKAIEVLSEFNVAGIIMNKSFENIGRDYYSY
jgi:Mrp family chromosome partitioning ATPase